MCLHRPVCIQPEKKHNDGMQTKVKDEITYARGGNYRVDNSGIVHTSTRVEISGWQLTYTTRNIHCNPFSSCQLVFFPRPYNYDS